MFIIKTGRAEIHVVRMNLEALQRVEGILTPLPDIAKHIVNA